jgi:acyl-CoA synthetase (NDP forming)
MALLTELESKKMLRKAGINVNDAVLALSRDEAIAASKEMGFPVVLKIASPDIAHKSDSGGVKLNLKTAAQVAKAYDAILEATRRHCPGARILGVSVQKMARPGVEVIIGVSHDKQFGPVLMFGLGGILVEVLKDFSLRIIPISRRDAAEMIREIKGYPLLEGFRGQEPVDVSCLERLLLQVSQFVAENPRVRELDLNPVFAYRDGAVAVDARIVLQEDAAKQSQPGRKQD